MQSILYDDEPYVTLYYNQTLEGYRSDHVTGFTPQPADTATVKGDALATYGPFSFISIRPVVGSVERFGRREGCVRHRVDRPRRGRRGARRRDRHVETRRHDEDRA